MHQRSIIYQLAMYSRTSFYVPSPPCTSGALSINWRCIQELLSMFLRLLAPAEHYLSTGDVLKNFFLRSFASLHQRSIIYQLAMYSRTSFYVPSPPCTSGALSINWRCIQELLSTFLRLLAPAEHYLSTGDVLKNFFLRSFASLHQRSIIYQLAMYSRTSFYVPSPPCTSGALSINWRCIQELLSTFLRLLALAMYSRTKPQRQLLRAIYYNAFVPGGQRWKQ